MVDVINPFDFPRAAPVAQRAVKMAEVVELLKPRPSDLVVLKSTLSGFYQTPLETLLRLAGAPTLVVTGLMADNCVLFTNALNRASPVETLIRG